MQTIEDGPETVHKKERGPVMVTIDNVRAVAARIAAKRLGASQEPQKKEGGGEPFPVENASVAVAGAPLEALVLRVPLEALVLRARVMRHPINSRILLCEVSGRAGLHPVQVRDGKFYRAGEEIEVRLNDEGRYEAAKHRIQPRYL